jgi:hypothetical protein
MRARGRFSFWAVLILAIVTVSSSVYAKPAWVEADERYRQGVQFFKEANYAAALIEFQRAYEVDPKYQVLYNIAQSYYQLQDYANALKSFKLYLEQGDTKISPKRRKEVEAEIETLSKRIATVSIKSSEPGAAVTIDDVAVGTTPLGPLTVSAGRRKIIVTLEGRNPVTRVIDFAGGDVRKLDIEIPAAARGERVVIERSKQTPPKPPSPVPMAVTWSLTGALVTGAVVTGVLALGASSDLEDELARFPGDPQALEAAKDSAFRLGLATDVLIGASIAGAAVATYFTVDFAIDSDAPTSASPGKTGRVSVVPGGLVVSGTF